LHERNVNVVFVQSKKEIKPYRNETVKDIALRSGIYIDQPCGGMGLCGKCRVKIDGVINEPSYREKELLSPDELLSGLRLACQSKAMPGMQITILYGNDESAQILEGAGTKSFTHEPKASVAIRLGIAIDIGTTTLVVYITDIDTGIIITAVSGINPQTSFGADVISRISYTEDHEDGLKVLQKCLIDKINMLITKALDNAGAKNEQILRVTAAGNTTMEHIFAGISPASIGKAPFEPQFYKSVELQTSKLNMLINDNVYVKLLPNVSGFVGGDIVSGILYSGISEHRELSLFVDIGTNNEIVLGNSSFLYCCSAAAGPAFEGAKISIGMRAAEGAIEKVYIKNSGEIEFKTIGNTKPKGLCGSGLVDLVAELLRVGIISSSGRFILKGCENIKKLADRVRIPQKGPSSFALLQRGEFGNTNEILLLQKDVREVQLAKSAIATGIELLLKVAGKEIGDVSRIYIAGAFGNYINIENAKRISILPNFPNEKIIPLGNSSGLGACMLLKNNSLWEKAAEIQKKTRHIELASHKDFQDIFVKNLNFMVGDQYVQKQ